MFFCAQGGAKQERRKTGCFLEPLAGGERQYMSVREGSSDCSFDKSGDDSVAADLRNALSEARTLVADYTEHASETARETIESHPLAAVAVAAVVGAALGFALTSSRSNSGQSNAGSQRDFTVAAAAPVPPPAPSRSYSESLTSRFEQVMDALTRVDPDAASRSWMGRARDFMRAWMSSNS